MRYENLEILDSLIEKGANLNSIDAFNCTPLITAIDSEKIDMVIILIEV